ncbi:hypothetical protein F0L68_39340 [Solihabitans fulvus]|uniref:Uncharacterized protein n=1 Tax=Solihabitans fulvus TaxID=1892852 RepID=A0A5B2WHD1_9PSEU|nr:hypothetical protein [Solihabitans fulvus]KAA2249547.1 hypothetical protein F0L68_39340 [Solihabitans fulvus]
MDPKTVRQHADRAAQTILATRRPLIEKLASAAAHLTTTLGAVDSAEQQAARLVAKARAAHQDAVEVYRGAYQTALDGGWSVGELGHIETELAEAGLPIPHGPRPKRRTKRSPRANVRPVAASPSTDPQPPTAPPSG